MYRWSLRAFKLWWRTNADSYRRGALYFALEANILLLCVNNTTETYRELILDFMGFRFNVEKQASKKFDEFQCFFFQRSNFDVESKKKLPAGCAHLTIPANRSS